MQDVQHKEAMPVEPEQPACLQIEPSSTCKKSVKNTEPFLTNFRMKRIGSSTFVVNIHFSKTSKETLEDKILRLAGKEAS